VPEQKIIILSLKIKVVNSSQYAWIAVCGVEGEKIKQLI
jgi:hypothetical protein